MIDINILDNMIQLESFLRYPYYEYFRAVYFKNKNVHDKRLDLYDIVYFSEACCYFMFIGYSYNEFLKNINAIFVALDFLDVFEINEVHVLDLQSLDTLFQSNKMTVEKGFYESKPDVANDILQLYKYTTIDKELTALWQKSIKVEHENTH